MPISSPEKVEHIWLPKLHVGQRRALRASLDERFFALRCGRRFGKTEFGKAWVANGLLDGEEIAWFAPEYKHMSEVYSDLKSMLAPLVASGSRSPMVIRLRNGARIDFFPLGNAIAARGRRYHRVFIDEAAFGKDGDYQVDDSAMAIWAKDIKPTLSDFVGRAFVSSNSAGENAENFFYNICRDPQYGFREFHATTMDNPLLPLRTKSESTPARPLQPRRYIWRGNGMRLAWA